MNISSLFNYPAYLYNPKQIFIRLARQFSVPGDSVVVCLPWGHRLLVNPREFIGHAIWQQGIYEINVCEAIARLVRPGDTVLDIGANIGFMTSLLARSVGPTGEVLAFEPHPELNERLRANISLFCDAACGCVTAEASALSDADGENWLVFDATTISKNWGTAGLRQASFASGKESVKVKTRKLDSVVHDRIINLAKIDVEGAELCVLQNFTPWRRGLDENFLAVLDPQVLLTKYRAAGWRVFRL